MLKSVALLIVVVLCLGLGGCATPDQQSTLDDRANKIDNRRIAAESIADSINSSATATPDEKQRAFSYVQELRDLTNTLQNLSTQGLSCFSSCGIILSRSNEAYDSGVDAFRKIDDLWNEIEYRSFLTKKMQPTKNSQDQQQKSIPIDTMQPIQDFQNQQQQNLQIQIPLSPT